MNKPLTGKGWEGNSPCEQTVLKLPCYGLSHFHNKRFGNVHVPLVQCGKAPLVLAWTWTILYRNAMQASCQEVLVGFSGRRPPSSCPDLLGDWSLNWLIFVSCLSQRVTSSFLFLMDWWHCVLWESDPGANGAVMVLRGRSQKSSLAREQILRIWNSPLAQRNQNIFHEKRAKDRTPV